MFVAEEEDSSEILGEVMGKEEEERAALQEKELPFIPFSGGSDCQLSHDELEISPSRPEPIPSISHLPSDPAKAGQCDAAVQPSERDASPRR